MKLPRGTRWEAPEGQVKGHMPQGLVGTSDTLHEETLSSGLHTSSRVYSPYTTSTCYICQHGRLGCTLNGKGQPSLPSASSRPR